MFFVQGTGKIKEAIIMKAIKFHFFKIFPDSLTQLHLGQCRGKGLCPCKKITTANTKWEVAQLYVFKWFQLQVSVVQKSACSLCGFLQLNLCYVQSVKWTWLRGAYSNTLFMLAAVRTLLVSMHIHVVLQGSMHPSHVTTLS